MPGKKDIATIPPSSEHQEPQGADGISNKIWHRNPPKSVVDTAWFTAAQAQPGPICEIVLKTKAEELCKARRWDQIGETPIDKATEMPALKYLCNKLMKVFHRT